MNLFTKFYETVHGIPADVEHVEKSNNINSDNCYCSQQHDYHKDDKTESSFYKTYGRCKFREEIAGKSILLISDFHGTMKMYEFQFVKDILRIWAEILGDLSPR